ncbi:MAG: ABC transporter substrate-binding protein [Planctomycetes bacterium]|nr:ABC transporter substrate-binding protein [Planctomycetota bacterium]MBL7185914.1 ABC transporter substrate-binding protein [Phycisphaerae bacterium]
MRKMIFIFIVLLICTAFLTSCKQKNEAETPVAPISLKIGHVGHDHHTALFVAMDNASEYARQSGINVKVIEDRKFYELLDRGKKIADLQIMKVGGASKMPTALAQGVIEIGFGGVAPVLASADSGAPVKLIAPLHNKGDMFVVRPDLRAKTWNEFVAMAKAAEKPLRVGYKNPQAVAKLVFEEALKHEGITFGGDPAQTGLQVQMVNVKGGSKLNVSLGSGLIDGYAGNNPFPAIAVEKGIGRIVCDLEELPPGTFRDHPCCCVAANAKAIEGKSEAIVDLLVLLMQGTETINADLDKAVAAAVRWIGTSESVERMSIPTSGYSMEPSEQWHQTMRKWNKAMDGLGVFRNKLKGLDPSDIPRVAYDLSLLEKARNKLARRRAGK